MKIVLLGTSSAIPTLYRSLSSTALIRNGDVFLFDCGEGTQVQLMRGGIRRSKIRSIFIGHLHGDHLYGINGLLSTLHLDNREAPLSVYGPQGLLHFLNAAFRTNTLKFSYPITVQEFPRGYRGRVLDEKEFYVDAIPLDHSIFCLGWRFQEKDRPGVFDLERAEALGIPKGPLFGKLQSGESVTLENGVVVHPREVLGEPRPGKSVAYCLDTQFSKRSIELAEGSTALIHETTFGPDGVAMAKERKHSTMEDAARVAAEAGAHQLIATHFSSRYDNREVKRIADESRPTFENITIARDLKEIKI
jgi:ribonuclease Z